MNETDTPISWTKLLKDLNERITTLSVREAKTLITFLLVLATALLLGGFFVVAAMRFAGCLFIAGALYVIWRKRDLFNIFGDE